MKSIKLEGDVIILHFRAVTVAKTPGDGLQWAKTGVRDHEWAIQQSWRDMMRA